MRRNLRRSISTLAVSVLATGGAVAMSAGPAGAVVTPLFTSGVPGPHTTDAVPEGICFVTITADGGHGEAQGGLTGGPAARVTARVPVTENAALAAFVGGAGNGIQGGVGGGGGGGYVSGGGGGGASVVSGSGNTLVVAGGGGGDGTGGAGGSGGLLGADGGTGGGTGGGSGGTSTGGGGAGGAYAGGGGGVGTAGSGGVSAGSGGAGANGIGGGGGGAGIGAPGGGTGGTGTGKGGTSGGGGGTGGAGNGSGGNGGNAALPIPGGGGGGGGLGFGGGGGGGLGNGGGGGGGYGGGGGGREPTPDPAGAGGGGGSSFVTSDALGTPSSELSDGGDGQVTITYDTVTDVCDNTPPTVTMTTPPDGATYTQNQVVDADFSCADTGGGVASCVGEVANGAALDTSALGQQLFTVKAEDYAGNTASVTHQYTVVAAGTKPGAPTDVKAGASASGTANVSFSPPADPGSSPVTAYQASCGGVNQGGFGSPIAVSGLPNGVAITCKVRARNAVGFGPFSAEVPFVPGVPWGPTSVTGGPGPVKGSVVVNWNAAQTNGAPITSYTVTCVPWSPSFPTRSVSVGGAKRTAQVNGLQTGAQHTCSIVPANSRGPGNPRVAQPVGTIKPKG